MRSIAIASSTGGTGGSPAVTITGTTAVGSVLTASITAGYGGTLTYQWVRGADGASDLTGASNISGATSSTYTLVSGDIGRVIGCLVSGLTYQGRTSGVVAGVAPGVTTAPAIVGTPEVGAAASYTTGTYSGTTPITKAVQWLLDGAVIVGETGSTYTPIEADEGKSLAIRETASNAWGSAASTSSGAVIAAAGAGGAEPLPIAGEYIQPFTYADGTTLISLPGWATYDASGVTTEASNRDGLQVKGNTLAAAFRFDFNSYRTGNLSFLRDVGSSDQVIRFRVGDWLEGATTTPSSVAYMRLIFGATDRQNALVLHSVAGVSTIGSLSLSKLVAGTESDLGSVYPPSLADFGRNIGTGDVVEIRLRSNVIHLYCNGVRLTAAAGITATGYTSGTKAGFGSNNIDWRVDDYYTAPLTATSVTVAESLNFWPASDTGRLVTVTGTTTGTPTALQTRVISAVDQSEIVPWTTNGTATFGAGTFSVSVFEPLGDLSTRARYITQVRPIEDTNGWSPGNAHAVGYCFPLYGQSNSAMRDAAGVAADEPNAYAVMQANHDFTIRWVRGISGSSVGLQAYAKVLVQHLGVPVGVICAGQGSQSVDNLAPGGTVTFPSAWGLGSVNPWTDFVAGCNQTGVTGYARGLLWTQGEEESNSAFAPDGSAYLTKFNEIVSAFRSGIAISASAPIMISVIGSYEGTPTNGEPQANINWPGVRQILMGLPAQVSNCHISSSLMHIPHNDAFHYTAVGYREINRRDGQTAAKLMGVATYDGRGPIITGGTRSGAVITMAVNLNGAASIAGTAVTGFDVSADNFATLLTISSVNASGGNVVITLAADPGAAVKVRSYWGYRPTQSSVITGTYSDGTTIQAEPIYNPITVS